MSLPARYAGPGRVLRNRDMLQVVRGGVTEIAPFIGVPVTISALPQTVHLELYQGDDVRIAVVVSDNNGQPADLTGVIPKSQIRVAPADSAPEVLATFTVFAQVANVIYLHLSSQDSTELHGRLVWDCQITSPSFGVLTLCAGSVTMTPEVTR